MTLAANAKNKGPLTEDVHGKRACGHLGNQDRSWGCGRSELHRRPSGRSEEGAESKAGATGQCREIRSPRGLTSRVPSQRQLPGGPAGWAPGGCLCLMDGSLAGLCAGQGSRGTDGEFLQSDPPSPSLQTLCITSLSFRGFPGSRQGHRNPVLISASFQSPFPSPPSGPGPAR